MSGHRVSPIVNEYNSPQSRVYSFQLPEPRYPNRQSRVDSLSHFCDQKSVTIAIGLPQDTRPRSVPTPWLARPRPKHQAAMPKPTPSSDITSSSRAIIFELKCFSVNVCLSANFTVNKVVYCLL